MTFTLYDETSRTKIDLPTQRQLNELHRRFGRVEFRKIDSKSWCVRIVTDDREDDPLPLAAIGSSLYEAANRMLRIVVFLNS